MSTKQLAWVTATTLTIGLSAARPCSAEAEAAVSATNLGHASIGIVKRLSDGSYGPGDAARTAGRIAAWHATDSAVVYGRLEVRRTPADDARPTSLIGWGAQVESHFKHNNSKSAVSIAPGILAGMASQDWMPDDDGRPNKLISQTFASAHGSASLVMRPRSNGGDRQSTFVVTGIAVGVASLGVPTDGDTALTADQAIVSVGPSSQTGLSFGVIGRLGHRFESSALIITSHVDLLRHQMFGGCNDVSAELDLAVPVKVSDDASFGAGLRLGLGFRSFACKTPITYSYRLPDESAELPARHRWDFKKDSGPTARLELAVTW